MRAWYWAGKRLGASSRMAGILEEVLTSLEAGQPIYLLGCFGGAAEAAMALLQGKEPPELSAVDYNASYDAEDCPSLDALRTSFSGFGLEALSARKSTEHERD